MNNLTQITGTVVDISTNLPINGSLIQYDEVSSYSNNKGKFKIKIPTTSSITLNITSPSYQSIDIFPYKGDNTIKTDLGIIQLSLLKDTSQNDKIVSSQLNEDTINIASSSKRDFKYYTQKKLNDSLDNIKNRLLPVIITLVSEFGVANVQKMIENGDIGISSLKNQISCPTQQQLTQLINRKNKLVNQLNQLLTTIDLATKAVGISGGIIEGLDIAYQILKNLPIPSAVAGVGVPISTINNVQDAKIKLESTIVGLKALNVGTLTILVILKQTLSQVLQYLSLLDNLIQHCYPDAELETVSIELTTLTNQQSNQISPIVINVNGFEMGVETEPTQKPLKRRRATATNRSGVVMLTGEWSFSSIDQILIDELVFYIQQNNLKAD